MQITSHTQPIKKKRTNKLVLGFAALVASAVVGTTGLAAANSLGNSDKPSKAQCAAAGFKNYGQCVKQWAKHKGHGYGGGYGGGNTSVAANVNVDIKGNNNVVQVIINFFR